MLTNNNFENLQSTHKLVSNTKLYKIPYSDLLTPFKNIKLPDGPFLDFGCGSGENTIQLAEIDSKKRIFGYDKHKQAELVDDRAITYYFEDSSLLSSHAPYSLITCNDVLHFIEDKIKFINFLNNLLHPQGYLALQFPDADPSPIRIYTIDFLKKYSLLEAATKEFNTATFPKLVTKDFLKQLSNLGLSGSYTSKKYSMIFSSDVEPSDWITKFHNLTWVSKAISVISENSLTKDYNQFLKTSWKEEFSNEILEWGTKRFFFWLNKKGAL